MRTLAALRILFRRFGCALAVLAISLPSPSAAQMPRPAAGYLGVAGIRAWSRSGAWSRLITVDSGGRGDYTSISAAISAAVAMSPVPAVRDRVVVLVYPGVQQSGLASYLEQALTIPDYVSVVGLVPGSAGAGVENGHVTIALTGTSGTLLSLGDATVLAHFDITAKSALTGATILVSKASGSNGASVIDVNLKANALQGDVFPLDMVSCSTGALYLEDVGIWRTATGTMSRSIVSSCSAGISHYRGRIVPGFTAAVAIETVGSGKIRLWSSRIDDNSQTCDLKSASANSIETYGVEYRTVCGAGTVQNATVYLKSISTPSGACAPGKTGYDSTNLYLCVAGTWRLIAHSALP